MKTIFMVQGYIAHATVDHFESGCEMDSKTEIDGAYTRQAFTLTGLIKFLCEDLCATEDCVSLNACEEDGRLDVQVYQLTAFTAAKPSARTMAKFKAGEIPLFLVDYSFMVEQINTEIDLFSIAAQEYRASNKEIM